MKIPQKYSNAILEIYRDLEGQYWIYMAAGWCINFSGEKVHTIMVGNRQKDVMEFFKDYEIMKDEDFLG